MRPLFATTLKLDWTLLFVVLLLVAFGLVALGSQAAAQSEPDFSLFRRQAVSAVVGLVGLVAAVAVDYRFLKHYGTIIFGVGVALLVAVLAFGTTIRGTTGWLSIGGFSFQPVELVKVCLIVFLSKYFSERAHRVRDARTLLMAAGATGLVFALTLLESDLGSGIIILAVFVGYLLVINIRRSYVLIGLASFAVAAVLAWQFVLAPYQKERILTFLDPGRDPLEQGYNIMQSQVAVGSGQLSGRGLSLGPQSQLHFLPESETDFIFAVIAEELGFWGVSLLIVLWAVLFFRILQMAGNARDDFALYLATGTATLLAIQVFINIGMNVGLVPVVGIPLPFVSFGGSSLVSSLIAVGILESVALRGRR